MFSIQIALYFLSLAFSHRFLARADDVVGCGGFVQSEVEINYSLVQVKYRIKTNLSKTKSSGIRNGFFTPVRVNLRNYMKKNLDITKPKQPQNTGPYFKVYNFKQKWLWGLLVLHDKCLKNEKVIRFISLTIGQT